MLLFVLEAQRIGLHSRRRHAKSGHRALPKLLGTWEFVAGCVCSMGFDRKAQLSKARLPPRPWHLVGCVLSGMFAASSFIGLTIDQRNSRQAVVRGVTTVSLQSATKSLVQAPANLTSREKIEWALWTAWHAMGNPRPGSKEVKAALQQTSLDSALKLKCIQMTRVSKPFRIFCQ